MPLCSHANGTQGKLCYLHERSPESPSSQCPSKLEPAARPLSPLLPVAEWQSLEWRRRLVARRAACRHHCRSLALRRDDCFAPPSRRRQYCPTPLSTIPLNRTGSICCCVAMQWTGASMSHFRSACACWQMRRADSQVVRWRLLRGLHLDRPQ